jgi:5-methylcytosine-specific restriction protein A
VARSAGVGHLQSPPHLCQCQHCKAEGRIKLATHVDHVVSKAKAKAQGWTDAQIDHPSNLQAINADCHERKGIEEYGGKAKPKRRIGIDGFPDRVNRWWGAGK